MCCVAVEECLGYCEIFFILKLCYFTYCFLVFYYTLALSVFGFPDVVTFCYWF